MGIRKARPAANPAHQEKYDESRGSADIVLFFFRMQLPKGRVDRYWIKYWNFSDYRSFKIGTFVGYAAIQT